MRRADFATFVRTDEMPADQGRLSNELQGLVASFNALVLRPMLSASVDDPDGVKAALQLIKDKIDALETVLDDGMDLHAAPASAGSSGSVNGRLTPVSTRNDAAGRGPSYHDDIGRNQKSRIREMTLLELLASEARPFSLQQLMKALEDRGMPDGQAAVVSQLHRMKRLGVIEQPANGIYSITDEGLGHLRKLRSSVGALVKADGRM